VLLETCLVAQQMIAAAASRSMNDISRKIRTKPSATLSLPLKVSAFL
jgi:hypothetical protein